MNQNAGSRSPVAASSVDLPERRLPVAFDAVVAPPLEADGRPTITLFTSQERLHESIGAVEFLFDPGL